MLIRSIETFAENECLTHGRISNLHKGLSKGGCGNGFFRSVINASLKIHFGQFNNFLTGRNLLYMVFEFKGIAFAHFGTDPYHINRHP